jgi:hypothetical protein
MLDGLRSDGLAATVKNYQLELKTTKYQQIRLLKLPHILLLFDLYF